MSHNQEEINHMASFRNLHKLILLQTLLILQILILVNGDLAAIIVDLCGGSPVYNFCSDCINSIPKAQFKDRKGLGNAGLRCGLDQSVIIVEMLKDLASKEPDETIRMVYQDCDSKMEVVGQDMVEGIRAYAAGDVKAALDNAKAADGSFYDCVLQFKQKVPTELSAAFTKGAAFVQIAQDLLQKVM